VERIFIASVTAIDGLRLRRRSTLRSNSLTGRASRNRRQWRHEISAAARTWRLNQMLRCFPKQTPMEKSARQRDFRID